MVKELAKEKNVDVEVPDDFYIKSEEYLSKQRKKQEKTELKGLKISKEYITQPLYYEDVYQTEFSAKVIDVLND